MDTFKELVDQKSHSQLCFARLGNGKFFIVSSYVFIATCMGACDRLQKKSWWTIKIYIEKPENFSFSGQINRNETEID